METQIERAIIMAYYIAEAGFFVVAACVLVSVGRAARDWLRHH